MPRKLRGQQHTLEECDVQHVSERYDHENGMVIEEANKGEISARDKKETGRRAIRLYATLGAGLSPNCSGLKNREKPELYHTRESQEVSRN